MTTSRWLLIALAACALASAPAPALADDAATAERLFVRAKTAMAAGQLAEACDLFAASQKAEGSASTLMQLASCREKNGQLASAWAAYLATARAARGDGRYGDMGERAAARAAALEPRLSYLTINVPDGVRVEGLLVLRDGVEVAPGGWNQALPVDGGAHTISGRAPGHETWSTTIEVAAEGGRAAVEVPRFKALRGPTNTTVVIDRQAASPWTRRRKVALGVAGAGALAVVAGAVLGLRAGSLDDQAHNTCPPAPEPCTDAQAARANQLADQARTRAIAANVGFGVGAAALVAGGVLWLTGGPREARRSGAVAITPHLDHRGAGVAATWSF
jgi:hypothetical protein